MRKNKKKTRVIWLAILILSALLMGGLLFCHPWFFYYNAWSMLKTGRLVSSAAISPNGKFYVDHVVVQYNVQIAIRNKQGNIVYIHNTGASDVQRWRIQWINDDVFAFLSSDIGDEVVYFDGISWYAKSLPVDFTAITESILEDLKKWPVEDKKEKPLKYLFLEDIGIKFPKEWQLIHFSTLKSEREGYKSFAILYSKQIFGLPDMAKPEIMAQGDNLLRNIGYPLDFLEYKITDIYNFFDRKPIQRIEHYLWDKENRKVRAELYAGQGGFLLVLDISR